jgi:imidazolonepropionase-like amidohydrolase
MMMCFAMSYAKLSLEEAFQAATRNSALALDRKHIGIVEVGAQADLLVWDKGI